MSQKMPQSLISPVNSLKQFPTSFTTIRFPLQSFGIVLILFFEIANHHCYLFVSHAALRFNDTERVAQILKCKFLKIAGKKVYVFPAYTELLCDDPKLGEPESKTVEIKEVAISLHDSLSLNSSSDDTIF